MSKYCNFVIENPNQILAMKKASLRTMFFGVIIFLSIGAFGFLNMEVPSPVLETGISSPTNSDAAPKRDHVEIDLVVGFFHQLIRFLPAR